MPGFGHPLYPDGDIRADMLLQAIREASPGPAPGLLRDQAVAIAVHELTGQQLNIDFALVAAARALKLPAEAPLALFALGRTLGWIAHAQEQYQQPELIRPRARYTGEPPKHARPDRW
jgi:citrate synthase